MIHGHVNHIHTYPIARADNEWVMKCNKNIMFSGNIIMLLLLLLCFVSLSDRDQSDMIVLLWIEKCVRYLEKKKKEKEKKQHSPQYSNW